MNEGSEAGRAVDAFKGSSGLVVSTRHTAGVCIWWAEEHSNLVVIAGSGQKTAVRHVQGCTGSGLVVDYSRVILIGVELTSSHVDGDLARGERLVKEISHAIGGGLGCASSTDNETRSIGLVAGGAVGGIASNTDSVGVGSVLTDDG